MTTHDVTIRCGQTPAAADPAVLHVDVGDEITWTPDSGSATATIAFRFPAHVSLSRSTATKGAPARGRVVSRPGRGEDLVYAIAVMEPAWSVPKAAIAELIIAVELEGDQSV